MTRTLFSIFLLIPAVFSASSTIHKLSSFNNTVATPIKDVLDGSKIYLSSRDKAAYLGRITLSTQGASKTLLNLLNDFDDAGLPRGWTVNSDLTISTTNSEGLTKNLTGELLIVTPTMAKDPNFLVVPARSAMQLDRSTATDTTIVFLAAHSQNTDGVPNYAGFNHIRVENIAQPPGTTLSFYRYLPNDNYQDVTNLDTIQRRIFSNPLSYFVGGAMQSTFFTQIDPIQFSQSSVWFRGVGGFKLNVSDSYVDTATIQTGAVTVTGMSNNQLGSINSQVKFMFAGDTRMGTSGYVLTTELFGDSHLALQLNGQGTLSSTVQYNGTSINNQEAQSWPALSLQLMPSNAFIGNYFTQYFNTDNGPIITSASSTASPPPSVSSSAAPNPSSTTNNPGNSSSAPTTSSYQSTSPSVETTTKFSSTSFIMLSVIATLLHNALNF
ncbi:hypothetical protein L5515_012852 [Caenorhabditis briggsae]|uniref:Uncharacterized protein n=1 Tax=Caenorhabditis briggsae TaxID=6238 RepID=A0AAE9EZV6_CAEBR|nr:hypothetical protein L5515_012852 [Caenorhabditis briggsae]